MNEHQKVFYILYNISIYFLFQPRKDVNTHHFSSSSPPTLIYYSPVWFVCRTKFGVMIGQIACQSSSREGSIDPKIDLNFWTVV